MDAFCVFLVVDHDIADGEARRMMHYLRDEWLTVSSESDGQVSFLFDTAHVLEDEARPRLPKAVQAIPQFDTTINHPP